MPVDVVFIEMHEIASEHEVTSEVGTSSREDIKNKSFLFAMMLWLLSGPLKLSMEQMGAARFQSKAQQEGLNNAAKQIQSLNADIKTQKSVNETMAGISTVLGVIAGIAIFAIGVALIWNPVGWAAIVGGIALCCAGIAGGGFFIASNIDAHNEAKGKDNWGFGSKWLLQDLPDGEAQLLDQNRQMLANLLAQQASQLFASNNKNNFENPMQLVTQFCSQIAQMLRNWEALANTQIR